MPSSDSSADDRPERRESVRKKTRPLEVRFNTLSFEGKGILKNASRDGLCILTPRPPGQGDMVSVAFRDLAGNWIELMGVVRWSQDPEESDTTVEPQFGMLIDKPVDRAYLAFLAALLRLPDAS